MMEFLFLDLDDTILDFHMLSFTLSTRQSGLLWLKPWKALVLRRKTKCWPAIM